MTYHVMIGGCEYALELVEEMPRDWRGRGCAVLWDKGEQTIKVWGRARRLDVVIGVAAACNSICDLIDGVETDGGNHADDTERHPRIFMHKKADRQSDNG